jgi:hypothetical protein
MVERVRHRRTKGAATDMLEPKATASHLDSKQTGGQREGRACPLCPDISDIDLFRYCQGIIYFDAQISDRAFDLGMT